MTIGFLSKCWYEGGLGWTGGVPNLLGLLSAGIISTGGVVEWAVNTSKSLESKFSKGGLGDCSAGMLSRRNVPTRLFSVPFWFAYRYKMVQYVQEFNKEV